MINRRQFSQHLITAVGLASLPLSAHSNVHSQAIASATRDQQGTYWLHMLSTAGEPLQAVALPTRAHQVIVHPSQPWLAVVARRPGYFVWIVNYRSGEIVQKITPEAGFHFYGHAAFSADGHRLFTTENEIATGRGKVVVRDLQQRATVVAQMDTHGVGPHQLALMPDKTTLVVANGGIATHPDHPRKKLNIDTMEPSLVYLDSRTGSLLEEAKVPAKYHQLSLRHLDVSPQGKVVIGFQYQGDAFDLMPLVATHTQGEALQFLWAPEPINMAMKQYVGSVCTDTSGRFAMLSCPKGNMVTLWDLDKQEFLQQLKYYDGCGVASPKAGRFIISTGAGRLFEYDMLSGERQRITISGLSTQSWDNHMAMVRY